MNEPEKIKTIIIVFMLVYYLPIYIYLFVWSVRIRRYVRNNKITSLDTVTPLRFKIGELTNMQKTLEVMSYATALFTGIFLFYALPKNMIKNNILPDDKADADC